MKKQRLALTLLTTGLTLTAGAVLLATRHARKSRRRLVRRLARNEEYSGAIPERLAARCTNGTFIGKRHNGVLAFKGIPYAQQPVGALRWKAPLAPYPDQRAFEAYYFGPSPIQTQRKQERASYYRQSEACLYLNVWTKAAKDERNLSELPKKRPVMVFIHGGSYAWGGTSNPLYDGHNLVAAHPDVVLVTVGYRLGVMGFVDFSSVPGGDEYPDAPNLGLLDQVEALRWIQENIAAFGGDPRCVTLFGESAGGGSVSMLAAMPVAKGLFHRVIAQSGSIALSYDKDECQAFTRRLLSRSHCTSMAELRALPTRELRRINRWITLFNAFPQRDGRHLPIDLYEAYRRGDTAQYDLLIGTNEDEARYWQLEVGGYWVYRFMLPVLYRRSCEVLTREDRHRLQTFLARLPMEEVWRKTEFYNEILFRLPAIAQAENHVRAGGRAFMYRWTFPSSIPRLRACHAVELAYVFGNLDIRQFTGERVNVTLARDVQQMWVNFAKTGDPSLPHQLWPPYTPDLRHTLRLDSKMEIESDPRAEARQLLSSLLKYRFGNVKW